MTTTTANHITFTNPADSRRVVETETIEYDEEGRVVKRVVVKEHYEPYYPSLVPVPQWWQQPIIARPNTAPLPTYIVNS